MSLTGFDKLQASWSKSEVADAAREAAVAAAQGRDSRSSEIFRFYHMNQWSRDTGSEGSFPPPPPEEFSRGSRRLSNSSAAQLAQLQLIQQGAAIDQGVRRLSQPEGVPEEVPIGHHGMQRAVQQSVLRSVPEGRVAGVEQNPGSLQAAPWLHGRMHLPTPRGFEDSDAGSAPQTHLPPPPPAWSPGPTPRTAASVRDNFSKWRDTINYSNVPIRPPDQNDSREDSRSSFYDSWMPWRQSRQHAHLQETTSLREDDLNERERAFQEQWQSQEVPEEFMPFQEEEFIPFQEEDLSVRPWERTEPQQLRQLSPEDDSMPFVEVDVNARSWDQEDQRHSYRSGPFIDEVPSSRSQPYEEHWQSQQRALAEESVPFRGQSLQRQSQQRASAEESVPFRGQSLQRHSEQHVPAEEARTSREENMNARTWVQEEQSWRGSPRISEDRLPAARELPPESALHREFFPPAPEHLPAAPELKQDGYEEGPVQIEVIDVDAHSPRAMIGSPPLYDSAPMQHPAGNLLSVTSSVSALKSALRSSAIGGPSDEEDAAKKRRGSCVSFVPEEPSLGIGEEPEPENDEEIGVPGAVNRKRSWRPWSAPKQEDPAVHAYKMQQAEAKRFSKKKPRGGRSSTGSTNSQASMACSKQKSLTANLSPQWKAMLKHATSFEADRLPEIVGGKMKKGQTAHIQKQSWGDCLASCCNALLEVDAPLLIPTCALILSFLFAIGLCGLLWSAEVPDLYEGAFGLITQTDRNATVDYTYFEKAREHAIASLSTVVGRQINEEDASLGDKTIIDYVNRSWAWRHVEVIYTRDGGNLVDKVDEMRDLESQMMSLTGWVSLCEKVPEEVKHFCNPGDSFASVLFGSNQQPDAETAAMGNLNQVVFDGQSKSMIMPLSQFVQFLKEFQEIHLKRWFADTGPKLADSPVRSTFAFYISSDEFQSWNEFVLGELEPLLYEVAKNGDENKASDGDEGPGLRVFYRVDGLDSHMEFVRAAAEDIPIRAVPPIGVFFAVLLTSRRLLLASTAAVLSVTTPLTSSTLLAGRGDTGKFEYPATTVAAWCIVSVSCCELALATANAWTMEEAAPMLPSWLRQKRCGCHRCPGWNVVYRVVRFLLEVPAPTLVPAFALSICSYVVDLPLVTEFLLHTSLGLLSAIFFSILIFPPACEIGNKMAESAKRSDMITRMRGGRFGDFLPFECGGEPEFLEKLEKLGTHLVGALSSKTVRTFAFLVTLAVVIGACMKDTSPRFIPDTPELWEEGHRLRVAPKVRELFGSGELVAGNGVPDQTFRSARKCTPDCYDSLDCSWYKCEVDGQKQIEEGKCSCFRQTVGQVYGIRGCGAVARFAALPAGSDAFAKVTFWRWAEEKLGVLLVNTSLSMFHMNVLEMESWATGLVTTETQMVVKTHGSDGQPPLWEDACLRVLCYCGPSQCKLDNSWSFFGDIEISAPDRRLQMQPSQSQVSLTNVRRKAENEIEINMVFGLRKTTWIPRKYVQPHMEFDTFVIESPWVQRHIYRYCAGIPPHLNINRHRCWVTDFRRWLEGNGEKFPIPAEDFYGRFHAFLAHAAYINQLQLGRDYDYFWLSSTGKVQGCYAVFNGHWDEKVGLEKYMVQWSLYMYRRLKMFPAKISASQIGHPWIASPEANAYSAASAVKDAAKNTVALSFTFLTLVTLTLTCSPGLTVAIVLIEAVTLGILVGIGVGLGRRDFGAMEVCGLAIFMSGLITPLIRVAHQYTLARDGPGEAPGKNPAGSKTDDARQFRPRSASVMGGDILGITDLHEPGSPKLHKSHSKEPAEGEVEEYLVDNSLLKARTIGLAYRLSPNLGDIDKKSRGHKGIAQWGTTVAGVLHKKDWIRVGNRFLPLELQSHKVLVWQERDMPEVVERLFSPEESEESDGNCMQELKASLFGPYDKVKIWRGAPFEERRRRSLTAVKRSSQTVIGASIAGFVAGIALVNMCMEALGRIGLAALCAAVTAPSAALGLLPMLAMVPLTGPSRVRRRAFAEFAEWVFQGKPRGSLSPSGMQDDKEHPAQDDAGSPGSSSAEDRDAIGEVSAEVLGLPFSLTVKSLAEHELPPSLQWMLGYMPESLRGRFRRSGQESQDGAAAEQDGAAEVRASAGTPAGLACVCGNVFMPDAVFCRKCGARRPQAPSPKV